MNVYLKLLTILVCLFISGCSSNDNDVEEYCISKTMALNAVKSQGSKAFSTDGSFEKDHKKTLEYLKRAQELADRLRARGIDPDGIKCSK